jgi:hypothetical protein
VPHINSVGDYCHGVGGSYFNVNNVAKFVGAAFGWLDDGRCACASGVPADLLPGDNWQAMIYTVATNIRVAGTSPVQWATTGFAGGGHAAWWPPLRSSSGLYLPAAGLLGMGPDAAIGYKPNYQSNGPTKVHELDGSEWTLTPNHAYDLRLLGAHRALWNDSKLGLSVVGIPMPQFLPGAVWFPQPFLIGGAWWIGYQSSNYGLVAHPFDNPASGYRLLPAGIDAWPAFRALTANSFRVVWSSSQAEQAGQMTALTIDVAGVPPGPIIDPGGGGGAPGWRPPTPSHPGPRARVAPRAIVRHQYPHVDGITDWRAKQTTRLLWDRVFDLEERLQSTESTTGDLVGISNSQDDHLGSLQASTEDTLARLQRGGGESEAGGPGLPTAIPQPPDLGAALVNVQDRLIADGEDLSGDNVGKIVRQFAWEHRADAPYGFGLLVKSGGAQLQGCSVQYLTYGIPTDFRMADVVGSTELGAGAHVHWATFNPRTARDIWAGVTSNPGYL